mmetsp:Transcript_14827/g.58161  ORF Transcript_14827/g.58161 Transcript_14827/m.58161 type:complete len:474 (+) Transcript_14827:799-2220(+)
MRRVGQLLAGVEHRQLARGAGQRHPEGAVRLVQRRAGRHEAPSRGADGRCVEHSRRRQSAHLPLIFVAGVVHAVEVALARAVARAVEVDAAPRLVHVQPALVHLPRACRNRLRKPRRKRWSVRTQAIDVSEARRLTPPQCSPILEEVHHIGHVDPGGEVTLGGHEVDMLSPVDRFAATLGHKGIARNAQQQQELLGAVEELDPDAVAGGHPSGAHDVLVRGRALFAAVEVFLDSAKALCKREAEVETGWLLEAAVSRLPHSGQAEGGGGVPLAGHGQAQSIADAAQVRAGDVDGGHFALVHFFVEELVEKAATPARRLRPPPVARVAVELLLDDVLRLACLHAARCAVREAQLSHRRLAAAALRHWRRPQLSVTHKGKGSAVRRDLWVASHALDWRAEIEHFRGERGVQRVACEENCAARREEDSDMAGVGLAECVVAVDAAVPRTLPLQPQLLFGAQLPCAQLYVRENWRPL